MNTYQEATNKVKEYYRHVNVFLDELSAKIGVDKEVHKAYFDFMIMLGEHGKARDEVRLNELRDLKIIQLRNIITGLNARIQQLEELREEDKIVWYDSISEQVNEAYNKGYQGGITNYELGLHNYKPSKIDHTPFEIEDDTPNPFL